MIFWSAGIALDEDLISGKECSCKRNDDSSSQAQEKFESASCDCAEDKGGKTFLTLTLMK